MIKVKVCGLTRAEDAEVAIAAGADAIGLIFAPSKRQVNFGQAKKVLEVIPPTILTVGVFVDQDPKWIKQLVGQLGIDRIQLHGNEKESILKQFPKNRIIKAINPKADEPVPAKDPAPDAGALLIDAYAPGLSGGIGKLSNWTYAKKMKQFNKVLILSGGLNPKNIQEAIQKVRPDMVDVSSGVEDDPGIKNQKKLKQFIKAAKTI